MSGSDWPFNPRDYDTRFPPLEPIVRPTEFLEDKACSHIAASSSLRSSSLYANPPSSASPEAWNPYRLAGGTRSTNPENKLRRSFPGSERLDLHPPTIPNRPVLGFSKYHTHRVTSLSEPAGLTLLDSTATPKTPSKLLESTFDMPGPLRKPKVSKVVHMDPTSVISSEDTKTKSMNHDKSKSSQIKTIEAARERLEIQRLEKERLQADLQNMTRKLETAIQETKAKCERKKKVPKTEWCSNHSAVDTCASEDRAKARSNGTKVSPSTSHTVPEKNWTDPSGSYGFADPQYPSSDMSYQHLHDAFNFGMHQARMMAQDILDDASKAKSQWRLGVAKVSTDLSDIERNAPASSQLHGKTVTLKAMPEKGLKSDTTDMAKDTVSSKSAVTLYIEQAAANYRAALDSGSEPKKINFSYDPMGSYLTAEQEATVKAEKTTSRTRIIAARLKALAAAETEVDFRWDNVTLSDDEDWEKVIDDEGDDWEVLEE